MSVVQRPLIGSSPHASTPNVAEDLRQSTVIDVEPPSQRPFALLKKFIGPGFMIAVGYLDPGNWATDLAAGSQFGYRLLFIILLSNLMAVLLQSLCIKLGVVTGKDLAQACRKHLPPAVNICFYVLCELAIIATDLAEVIGTAIALKLLFNIPLPIGVVVTALDVLVILAGWNPENLRLYEWFIMTLMLACGVCFAILIGRSHPDWSAVAVGFMPTSKLFSERGELYIAMGIIGATVMPHNLYLHSSIVKYRSTWRGEGRLGEINEIDEGDDAYQPLLRKDTLPVILKLTHFDSIAALSCALLINAAILIVAAANFHFGSGRTDVAELEDAFRLLRDILGQSAAILFAVSLLFAGQSSTITGTMAGQIVMEGFLGSSLKLPPWLRRIITRTLAIIPAMIVALLQGDRGVNDLLVLSQVVLSLQLPFAVWPLVIFTSNKKIMTVKFSDSPTEVRSPTYGTSDDVSEVEEDSSDEVSYANSVPTTMLAITVGALITVFNVGLLVQVATGTA